MTAEEVREKRRAERKQRHLQDDLRYALKKIPELHDANMSYEEVSVITCARSCLGLPSFTGSSPHGRTA